MSLILPPFQFSQSVHNLSDTVVAANPGTVITSGVSNADGTAVTLLSALAFDAHYLILVVSGTSTSAAASGCLMDLLVDPAGGTAWVEKISGLLVGYQPVTNTGQVHFHFPLFIKAGNSVGARMRCSHTVAPANTRVQVWAFGGPNRPEQWWCGNAVETLGAVPASSEGTPLTPGNSSVFSAWTTIGTSTKRYGAMQFGIQPDTTALTAVGYQWEFGYNSLPRPAFPRSWYTGSTGEAILGRSPLGPLFCDIPSGTVLQGRAACSGTAIAHTMTAYGVY